MNRLKLCSLDVAVRLFLRDRREGGKSIRLHLQSEYRKETDLAFDVLLFPFSITLVLAYYFGEKNGQQSAVDAPVNLARLCVWNQRIGHD